MKTFALRQLLAATASAEGSLTPSEGHAEVGQPPRRTLLLRNDTRARWPPISEAFLLAFALHFYSGQPLQNLSGADSGRFNQSHTWRELVELYRLTQPARNLRPRYNIAPITAIDAVKW
jgi:hypothetical protein